MAGQNFQIRLSSNWPRKADFSFASDKMSSAEYFAKRPTLTETVVRSEFGFRTLGQRGVMIEASNGQECTRPSRRARGDCHWQACAGAHWVS